MGQKLGSNTCYHCGEPGHRKRECPQRTMRKVQRQGFSVQSQQQSATVDRPGRPTQSGTSVVQGRPRVQGGGVQGRVFHMTQEDMRAATNVVAARKCEDKLKMQPIRVEKGVVIGTPLGKTVLIEYVYKGCRHGRVIAYASRQLKTHEVNYPVHDLELAVVRRWMELIKDYDCIIDYHPGKANVVADALSRKNKAFIGGLLVRGDRELLELGGLNVHLDVTSRGMLLATLVLQSDMREKIRKAQGSTKMYRDLKESYWWPKMKREIAEYVAKKGHDAIWVIVDRLTKSSLFLPMKMGDSVEKLAQLYIKEVVRLHGVPLSIVSDRDPRFTSRLWSCIQRALGTRLNLSTAFHPQTDGQSERTIQILEDLLWSCILEFGGQWEDHLSLVEFTYNNSYQSTIRMAPYEALYGRRCRTAVCWDEVGERKLLGPELVQITVDKVKVIKERMKEAQD
eukprot:XP_024455418.1 uncharacterized protein LOC112327280 [Populus trichocarpa]